MTSTVPAAEVRDLLQAISNAAAPNDIDRAAMLRRLVTIQVEVDGILAAFRVSTQRPDLPSIVPAVMAAATASLRALAGEDEDA